MNSQMTMDRLAELHGSAVYDQNGEKIGKVEEVYYDEASSQAGMDRHRHRLPRHQARARPGRRSAGERRRCDGAVRQGHGQGLARHRQRSDRPRQTEHDAARLLRHDASRPAATRPPRPSATPIARRARERRRAGLTRSEEELRVGKRSVDAGSRAAAQVGRERARRRRTSSSRARRCTSTASRSTRSSRGAEIGEQTIEVHAPRRGSRRRQAGRREGAHLARQGRRRSARARQRRGAQGARRGRGRRRRPHQARPLNPADGERGRPPARHPGSDSMNDVTRHEEALRIGTREVDAGTRTSAQDRHERASLDDRDTPVRRLRPPSPDTGRRGRLRRDRDARGRLDLDPDPRRRARHHETRHRARTRDPAKARHRHERGHRGGTSPRAHLDRARWSELTVGEPRLLARRSTPRVPARRGRR